MITGEAIEYLVDPENADIAAKKRVAGTQSHEVAHMWYVSYHDAFIHVVFDRIDLQGSETSRQWSGGTIYISRKVLSG